MLLVWTARRVANTLGMWRVQSRGFLGDVPSLFGEKMAKKPLFEQQVGTQAGVSDTAVCSAAPYEDVSPSTL